MRWFPGSGARLPQATRKRLALQRGERVLAHTATRADVVVATTQALHIPGADGHTRIAWEHVDAAVWSEDGLVFTDDTGAERAVGVQEPGRLPEVVQERVTASIAASRHVVLPVGGGSRGVRLSARRAPGAGSENVTWQVRYDAGLDPQDPETRSQAEQALTNVRRQTGL